MSVLVVSCSCGWARTYLTADGFLQAVQELAEHGREHLDDAAVARYLASRARAEDPPPGH